MKNKIKLIIFDFTGVVVSGGHKWLAKKIRKKYLPRCFTKQIYDIFYTKYFNLAAVNKISLKDSWLLPMKHFGIKGDWRKFRDLYLYSHKLKKQTANLMKKLKKDYRVIILTKNVNYYFKKEIKMFKLHDLTHDLLNTQDLNLPKMSPKTLEYVLNRFRVKPKEIVYVDDQLANLNPIKSTEVKTIFYRNFKQFKRELKKFI